MLCHVQCLHAQPKIRLFDNLREWKDWEAAGFCKEALHLLPCKPVAATLSYGLHQLDPHQPKPWVSKANTLTRDSTREMLLAWGQHVDCHEPGHIGPSFGLTLRPPVFPAIWKRLLLICFLLRLSEGLTLYEKRPFCKKSLRKSPFFRNVFLALSLHSPIIFP